MKAREMFEELGYKYSGRYDNDDFVTTVYYKVKSGYIYRIGFHEDIKKYSLSCRKDDGEIIVDTFYEFELISHKLHLAITQQMKELGWLE